MSLRVSAAAAADLEAEAFKSAALRLATRALRGMDADDEAVGLIEPACGKIRQQIFRGMMVDGHVNRPENP